MRPGLCAGTLLTMAVLLFLPAAVNGHSPFPLGTPSPESATPADPTQLKTAHQDVLDELNTKNADGKLMELDDPRVPNLVRNGWKLAGAWLQRSWKRIRRHRNGIWSGFFDGFAPPPNGVKSKYGNFLEYSDYTFRGSAIRINPSVYVVEASYGVEFLTGTFMVIARNEAGHLEALWNIKDLAEKHYAQRDEIGRWMHLVRRAYYNGPLTADHIVPLSPTAGGHARFLVNAYQGADGGMVLAQLSIWE